MPPVLDIRFHGNLKDLLHPRHRRPGRVAYTLDRRASIKDIIESLRIPHTEIGRITAGEQDVTLAWVPEEGGRVDVFPLAAPVDPTRPTLLRPETVEAVRFLADVNVGKLATLLRMAGMDTATAPGLDDRGLVEKGAAEGRILLSRNRDLLKRGRVVHGHLVRSQEPREQLAEVLALYDLAGKTRPFSRCLRCNTLLQPVAKAAILHRLQPLTRKYYHHFHICPACRRIYWRGSHHHNMQRLLTTLGQPHGQRDQLPSAG